MPVAHDIRRHGTGQASLASRPPAAAPPPAWLPPPSGPAVGGPSAPRRRRRWPFAIAAVVVLVAAAIAVVVMWPRTSPNFVAESMRYPDTIVAGETLEVEVDVRNDGDGGGDREFTLLVDDEAAAATTVDLDADSSRTLELAVTGLEAGSHDLAIEGFADVRGSIRVLTPAAIVIDELTVSPDRVDLAVSPTVTATARFSNTGEASGTEALQLSVDGQALEQREVSLQGGESGEATFTLTMDTPGHPVVAVNGATAEVWVLAPAQLAMGSVTVTPNPADLSVGNIVTVTALVSNSGEIDGTFSLELAQEGVVIETRDVAVPAGQSIEQQFAVTLLYPGLQVLSVNGIPVELEVYQLGRPDDGAVLLDSLGNGPNLLTIANQRDEDVYVVLTASGDGQPPLFGVYVHAGSIQTLDGIPAGTYTVFFEHGSAWCLHYQRFTESPHYGRFDDDAWFESTDFSYTEITLTFGSDLDWSPTTSLDPADFPA